MDNLQDSTKVPCYDVINRPKTLFKFYGNSKILNKKRLLGEVYLASPLEFNDPCDCQREVRNNAADKALEKGEEWVVSKLVELGYSRVAAVVLSRKLIDGDNDVLKEIHNKQLEKAGVLCMSCGHADSMMWGYYTNNQGFCLEYDVDKLFRGLLIGYVNNLDYCLTRFLFEDKQYKLNPEIRTSSLRRDLLDVSNHLWSESILDAVSNPFLNEKNVVDNLNFIKNVFLKRFVARSITYGVMPKALPSFLFFDGKRQEAELKYFRKTSRWQHEDEFRFFFSLGGRQVIKLGPDVVKNVYLGCNMNDEDVISFAFLIATSGLRNVGLYKMMRLRNGGLQHKQLDFKEFCPDFIKMKMRLDK